MTIYFFLEDEEHHYSFYGSLEKCKKEAQNLADLIREEVGVHHVELSEPIKLKDLLELLNHRMKVNDSNIAYTAAPK